MDRFLPVITFKSGTLSGERSIVRGFRSKASLKILFFVADPHSLYKPIHKRSVWEAVKTTVHNKILLENWIKPIISRPRFSTSSTHLRTIIGTAEQSDVPSTKVSNGEDTDSHSLFTTVSKSTPNKQSVTKHYFKVFKRK